MMVNVTYGVCDGGAGAGGVGNGDVDCRDGDGDGGDRFTDCGNGDVGRGYCCALDKVLFIIFSVSKL